MNIDNSMGELCVGETKYENRLTNRPYFLSSSKNIVVKTTFYYIIY